MLLILILLLILLILVVFHCEKLRNSEEIIVLNCHLVVKLQLLNYISWQLTRNILETHFCKPWGWKKSHLSQILSHIWSPIIKHKQIQLFINQNVFLMSPCRVLLVLSQFQTASFIFLFFENLFVKNGFHFCLLSPSDSFNSSHLFVRDGDRQKAETATFKDMVCSVGVSEAVKTQRLRRSNHSHKKVSIYLIVVHDLCEAAVIPAFKSTRSYCPSLSL